MQPSTRGHRVEAALLGHGGSSGSASCILDCFTWARSRVAGLNGGSGEGRGNASRHPRRVGDTVSMALLQAGSRAEEGEGRPAEAGSIANEPTRRSGVIMSMALLRPQSRPKGRKRSPAGAGSIASQQPRRSGVTMSTTLLQS